MSKTQNISAVTLRSGYVGDFVDWWAILPQPVTYAVVKFNQPDRANEEQDAVRLKGRKVTAAWYDKTGDMTATEMTFNTEPLVNGEHDFYWEGLTLGEYVQALVSHEHHTLR